MYALLPVPNTCNQFYRCWLGRPSIHTCPSGLVFDGRPEVRRCSFIHGTGCEGDETIIERCPAEDGPTPVYMADAYSCSRYYVCHGGTPIARECSIGLHFNPLLRICDTPQNAGCTSADVSNDFLYVFNCIKDELQTINIVNLMYFLISFRFCYIILMNIF